MKEFLLDAPIPEGFFSYLENFGRVEALPNLGEGSTSSINPIGSPSRVLSGIPPLRSGSRGR